MTLPPNLTDKEHGKFRDNVAGPVIAVSNADGSAISTGGGGGTAMVDKAAMVEATSSYTPSGGVFNDTLAAVASGVGAWFRITAFRALHVNLRNNSGTEIPLPSALNADGGLPVHVNNGGGGASATDNSAFTAGTTAFTPIGGDFDDTPPTAITTAHAATARITANRALHANLRNQAGTELGTATTPVRTDPTGTTAQPTSATIAVDNVGLAKDATLTGGTAKAIPHTPAKGTTAAGDVTSANVDANTQAMHVQLAGTQASVPVTGTFWQATQPVSEADGSNATIGITTGTAVTTDATGTLQQYLRGLVKILADVWDSTNHWLKVSVQAATSGGATSASYLNGAAAVIAQNVKASAGNIYSVVVTNASGGCYVRLYDKATAPATTDTPIFRAQVPVNATAANGAGIVIPVDVGLSCTLGIGIRVTGAAADNDATTFATANTVLANVIYK